MVIILFIETEGEIYCVDVENVTLTFCVERERDVLVSAPPPPLFAINTLLLFHDSYYIE